MPRPWFYSVLEIPWVYNLSQILLAPGAKRIESRILAGLAEPTGDLGLDFGCGPRLTSPFNVRRVVGVDVNADYIRQYNGGEADDDPLAWERQPERSLFGFLCKSPRLPFADGTFDVARCMRALHHMSDATATAAVREMARCLRPGGLLLLYDPVHPRAFWRRPIAGALTHLDRGEHVRTEPELVRLVKAACPGHWAARRCTSSYLGLESVLLTWRKARAGAGVGGEAVAARKCA